MTREIAKLTQADRTAPLRRARIGLPAAVVVAALALVGCGGSGSSSSASEGSSNGGSQSATTSEETSSEAASSNEAGGSTGGLTPPGTQLKLGQSATVAWVPPGSFEPSKSQSGIELEVTAEAIEEGSAKDLTNIELEPSEQGAIPFYVHLRLEAPSGQAPPAEEDPAYSFEAIDDRGQEQASVTFIGSFPSCEEKEAPKPFDKGASYETCLTYLMKGGGSIEKVEWNNGPAKANEVSPYFEHPIVWAGG